MHASDPLASFRILQQNLVLCVRSMPETSFLSRMNGWSPRDIVAHLVGWNRLMIQASRSILAGEPPACYADSSNDYRNINAAFVEYHSSRSRSDLLEELRQSFAEFDAFIQSLPVAELQKSRGVKHYSGEPATIAKIIRSLSADYQTHTDEMLQWVARQEALPRLG